MAPTRVGPSLLRGALVVALAMLGCESVLFAQFGPLLNPAQAPQARTQEELDSYLEIVAQTDAKKTVEKAEAFASRYPNSELLGIAYQYQARACEQLGDFAGALKAGDKALRAHPDNLNTLLILATAIANHGARRPGEAALLAQAEGYARKALTGIDRTQIPRKISPTDWEHQKRTMQSQAHEVLGVVAIERGQAQTAIKEFTTAVRLNPVPQGDQFFRLGVAYASSGDPTKAKECLERAAKLGPPLVRKRALDELDKLSGNKPAPK